MPPNNAMCRTYTIGEILDVHGVAREHEMTLVDFVIGCYRPPYSHSQWCAGHRPWRSETWQRHARVYHPMELPEIKEVKAVYFKFHEVETTLSLPDFDWDKTQDETKPLLVSASYGRETDTAIDVTEVVRYKLIKQGKKGLYLEHPAGGPRYWYNALFGDPFPGATKRFWLTIREPNGKLLRYHFLEDTSMFFPLRAGASGDDLMTDDESIQDDDTSVRRQLARTAGDGYLDNLEADYFHALGLLER